MIVSDHGMTESGNHGGSSYEETDSLALFVGAEKFSYAPETNNKAHQVDIAVTLALLFGVPIPRNNVGTVMAEVFSFLEDEQKLRILQMNSWQLMRLLQTHLTESGCGKSSCVSGSGKTGAERFCCLYLDATALHENYSRSGYANDYRTVALAYHNFLRTATEWLSSRATDKPIGLLASGIAAMLLSCLGLMSLLLLFNQDTHFKNSMQKWHLDEIFIPAVIFILIISMGSSSMVEEEQYIWHFMTSSLYLILLRRAIQSKASHYHQIYSVITVLLCGRVLRGWHQGGVNWSYLPDISKFLEQSGTLHIKSLQLLSTILVISTCLLVLLALKLRKRVAIIFVLVYIFPVLLILKQIFQYQDSIIQIIYAVLGISTVGIFVATPWLMPLQNLQTRFPFGGIGDSVFVIGWCYVFSWCLLQLILQQPVNSMPTSLLLMQIVASIRFFSDRDLHVKQWVKVAALYYVGMAGHFGLGNTNTLATIDVAGAFVGISSHSTIISGILMFIITYASPMLVLLSMLMNVFNKDLSAFANVQNIDFGHILKMILGYNCLVPLGLNSILLLSYTIVLLLMQNHLFVWSVFSPKYLYVCATTACVYIGVSILSLTTAYICMVFGIRVTLKRNRSTERLPCQ
ncbi:hypothetical protein ACJIZ3_002539 [Penstemon smallii]|uniref:GPI ethanolamine phosphate transferase 2 C-terminal domain-containing protein n=1 Tax=Penstemon smallii TaxID=265156 RepID=A0ABD3U6S4_9LAMI